MPFCLIPSFAFSSIFELTKKRAMEGDAQFSIGLIDFKDSK